MFYERALSLNKMVESAAFSTALRNIDYQSKG